MSNEWQPVGAPKPIREPILEEIGNQVVRQGANLEVPLLPFNETIRASRSGVIGVVEDAECLDVKRIKTPDGTELSAVYSETVIRKINSGSTLGTTILTACGTALHLPCAHLKDGCPLRDKLIRLERNRTQLLIGNESGFCPSNKLIERYVVGNMAMPQQAWSIVSCMGEEILANLGNFRFVDLYNSRFSPDQLKRIGIVMSHSHIASNINATIPDYHTQKGIPRRHRDISGDELNAIWAEQTAKLVGNVIVIMQSDGILKNAVRNPYGKLNSEILKELDSLGTARLTKYLTPLKELYKFSAEFLHTPRGEELSKLYKLGFRRQSGQDYAKDFHELRDLGFIESYNAYREYIDRCFTYAMQSTTLPEAALREIFSINDIPVRIFEEDTHSFD